MAQEAHFTATADAQDISAGRAAGCYLAQYTSAGNLAEAGPLMYATAAAAPAPASDQDYFEADVGGSFTFRAGDGIMPTWVKRPAMAPAFDSPDFDISVAVAKVD